jgi:methylphosphotriester-DNA--protein-cysteine methyltransferase
MEESVAEKLFKITAADGALYESEKPGIIGGHKKLKIYGRLDCPSALRYIALGQYVTHRVFFSDEATAIAAGYRPCAKCMRDKYDVWKQSQKEG